MIQILALFLALATGVHPVELQVADPVTQVEISMDGEVAHVLEGPPWRFLLDLGHELLPHRLNAVALDSQGLEIGRTHRWINLSAPADGATFDPTVFDSSQSLTAVAVELEPGHELPSPQEMEGWFLGRGEPLSVVKVDQGGPTELLVVRDPATTFWFETVAYYFLSQTINAPVPPEITGAALGLDQASFLDLVRDNRQDTLVSMQQFSTAWHAWNQFMQLEGDAEVRFLSPLAAPASTVEDRKQIFNVSRPFEANTHGVLFRAAGIRPLGFELRISDAIALAGLEAHASRRRRAVLAVLTDVPRGPSRYRPEETRKYLAALGVPLFVWSFEQPMTEWEATQVYTIESTKKVLLPKDGRDLLKGARRASENLRRKLAQQHIVWIEGTHLPQDIKLSTQATGLALAGRPWQTAPSQEG